jgi:hypothetical protein
MPQEKSICKSLIENICGSEENRPGFAAAAAAAIIFFVDR